MVDVLCVSLNPALDQTLYLDGLHPGQVHRVREQRLHAGGKALNVASCLSDFGIRCAMAGGLGQENAACFETHMARKGLMDCCHRIAGSTRTNLKLVDLDLGETTDLNLPGFSLAPCEALALMDSVFQAMENLRGLQWVVLSGSLPPGLEPHAYATLIRHAHGLGLRVLLDTSGEALVQALREGPELLKPNREELSSLLGQAFTDLEAVQAAAHRFVELQGPSNGGAVSLGGDGALFWERGKSVFAHALSVDVQSTVGAGDAMAAGLLAARLRGLELEGSARLATAFAAAWLQDRDLREEQVRSWVDEVQVREVRISA